MSPAASRPPVLAGKVPDTGRLVYDPAMAWKPAWVALALVVPCGCSIEDLDRPQPEEDPPGGVVVAGGGVTVGSGGAGGASTTSTTTSSSGGGGGSSATGAGFLLNDFCGCLEGFVSPTVPGCESCVNSSKTIACAGEWADCQASQLCQDILASIDTCPLPYNQLCMDTSVFMNEPGITPLIAFLSCACNNACAPECPAASCQ